jgi:hypothetical protein
MSTSSLTKDEVMKLIKNDDSSVTFVKPKPASSQSEFWANFNYIYHNNHKRNFVLISLVRFELILFNKLYRS